MLTSIACHPVMYPTLWQMDTVIPEQLCVLIPYITMLRHIITNTRNHFCHLIIELSVRFVGVPRLFGQTPLLSWQYCWPDKAHVELWVPIHIFPFVAVLKFFSWMYNEDVGWLPVVFCQHSKRMNTSQPSYVGEAYAPGLALPSQLVPRELPGGCAGTPYWCTECCLLLKGGEGKRGQLRVTWETLLVPSDKKGHRWTVTPPDMFSENSRANPLIHKSQMEDDNIFQEKEIPFQECQITRSIYSIFTRAHRPTPKTFHSLTCYKVSPWCKTSLYLK